MEEEKQNNLSQGNEYELVPLEADVDSTICDRVDDSFISEIRHNKETRRKFIESLGIALSYMILGWTKGQLGPALLDLMFIANVDLEKGSGFMTSYYAGRLLGALLGGVIYSKLNTHLVFVISITVNGIVVAGIPWCSSYELMLAAHVIHGTSGGVLDVAIITEGVTIWGPSARGRAYLQILCASFAISGILAPMATAPFLLQNNDVNDSAYEITDASSITTNLNITLTDVKNSSNNYICNNTTDQTSHLYIAYSISSGIALFTTLPFVIFFLQSSKAKKKKKRENKTQFIGDLPVVYKRLQVLNMGIFTTAITITDHMFGGYLSVFCVQYMNWTKTGAAMLTSVVFVCTLVGRMGGVLLVQKFKSHTLLFVACLTCTVGFIGITISAHAQFNIRIWLSVCVIGTPFGILWPVFLSWVNEYVIPIDGKVTSFLLVVSFLGLMVSPVIIGCLMDNIALLWFCYFCLIMSVIVVVNVVFIIIYIRCMSKRDRAKHP